MSFFKTTTLRHPFRNGQDKKWAKFQFRNGVVVSIAHGYEAYAGSRHAPVEDADHHQTPDAEVGIWAGGEQDGQVASGPTTVYGWKTPDEIAEIMEWARQLCHCGSEMHGSDHCPTCGCEEYESTCDHRIKVSFRGEQES